MPDGRPVTAALRVGVPASVSRYRKLAVLDPVLIVTLVIVELSVVFRKTPPDEDVVRLTVVVDNALAAAPVEVCSCTVIVPPVVPAVRVCTLVVNTTFDGAEELTVSVAVAVFEVKVAVTVCAPVTDAEQVGPEHDPLGEIANAVEPVTTPRLLLKASNAVVT